MMAPNGRPGAGSESSASPTMSIRRSAQALRQLAATSTFRAALT